MDKKKIENLQKAVAEAGQAVADIADDVITAVEPTVTAAVKDVSDMAAPVIKEAGKKAAPAVKRAKKAVTAILPEVYIQVNGKEFSCSDISDKVKADYKNAHKDMITSCKIYVKPEDDCAYYVINDVEGKVEL